MSERSSIREVSQLKTEATNMNNIDNRLNSNSKGRKIKETLKTKERWKNTNYESNN